jgi:hypothetical protein
MEAHGGIPVIREQLPRKSDAANAGDAAQSRAPFTDAGSATVAALLHLIRLMGAELVLTRGGLDCARLEAAVRTKIEQFPSPTANPEAREAGLTHARYLVERVLSQIRAQAELKKSLAGGRRAGPEAEQVAESVPRFLN